MSPSTSLPHWSHLFWDMFFCCQWLNSQPIIITAEAWFFCQKTYISLKTGFHYWHSKLIYVHTNFTVSISKLFIYGVFKSILVSMKLFILCKCFSLPSSCCCAFRMWFPWSVSAASCHHPLMFCVWDPFKHIQVKWKLPAMAVIFCCILRLNSAQGKEWVSGPIEQFKTNSLTTVHERTKLLIWECEMSSIVHWNKRLL